jgi:hypothetical protein
MPTIDYNLLATLGSTTVPSGSRTTKNIWTFTVSEKQMSQNGAGVSLNSWLSTVANLDVVKGRHEVGGNLCRLLFGYGVGRILFTGPKDVFQRTTVLAPTLVAEKLAGHCWNRQQKGDQDCSEIMHTQEPVGLHPNG